MYNHPQSMMILDEVNKFLESIPESNRFIIYAHLKALQIGSFEKILIKTLRSPLRELKVGRYRILFFSRGNSLFVISAFVKKSQKTPLREINRALALITILVENLPLLNE